MSEQSKSPPISLQHSLNTVCPYFTMFPLEFPLSVLRRASKNAVVLDPFCGRGTTNYAARCLGLESYGLDTSPVAIAIAQAKLARTNVHDVLSLARQFLDERSSVSAPTGRFWKLAYHPKTLMALCRIRKSLLKHEQSDAAVMLRAVVLGGLHGPLSKNIDRAGYFSNQMPRTYAPKPRYAAKYWTQKQLNPPAVDILRIIRRRVERALHSAPRASFSTEQIRRADSSERNAYAHIPGRITHVITSPPYYGLRTYVEDQWLRNWFLGGPDEVPYGQTLQVSHESPEAFVRSLTAVWDNIALKSSPRLQMVVRFGAIGSRKQDAREIFKASLAAGKARWRLRTIRPLSPPPNNKRQANHMSALGPGQAEYDFYISL
jgi:hypothetical protein